MPYPMIRTQGVVLAAALLAAGVPGVASAAPGTVPALRTKVAAMPQGATRLRFKAGRDHFDAGRWTEAGQAWSDALDQIPESPVNRDTRMNLVLDSIAAYRIAYDETGDVAHLQSALDTYYRYFSVFKTTYGSPNIPRSVVVARFALIEQIDAAKTRQPEPPPPPAPTTEEETPTTPTDAPATSPPPSPSPARVEFSTNDRDRPRDASTGLIVGGAVTMALGLGASSMIAVGAIGGKQAREDSKSPDFSDDQRARIDERGRTMNAVFIAGLVTTPVLVGAGATLLGIGIHRRNGDRRTAVVPSVGPQFTGLTVSGRF